MLKTSSTTTRINPAQNRTELYQAHRKRYRPCFATDGSWIESQFGEPREQVDYAREWLWHALAFLAGDESDIELANAILRATPNVANHFNPVVAAQILVRCKAQLSESTRKHLLQIVIDGIPEAIDSSLATAGLNNFTMMRAMLFLTASQCVEKYQPGNPHGSIDEVYNHYRLRQFGRNILCLIEQQLERSELAHEFNSPTYSPISLLAAAEIVNLIDDIESVKAASRIEQYLWAELLTFYHPALGQTSGPMSRGYFVDHIGHANNWRILCAMLGLDQTHSVLDLLYPPMPGQVSHGDLVSEQAIACWLASPDYHPPQDWRKKLNQRQYPFEHTASYEWPGYGFKRADGTLVSNVEGDDCVSSGTGVATVYQNQQFALGSMSQSYSTQNVPCHAAYHIDEHTTALGATRSAYPTLTRLNADGITHSDCGAFTTAQNGETVSGTAKPWHWLHTQGVAYQFNLVISEHLPVSRPVERILFDAAPVEIGRTLSVAQSGQFHIIDGCCELFFDIHTPEPVEFIATRHDGLLMCSAVVPASWRGDLVFNFEFRCCSINRKSDAQ